MPSLFADERPIGYARIAVERAVDIAPEGLTYAIPSVLKDLQVGERVSVPLGRGDSRATGYVVQIISIDDAAELDVDPDRIKPIIDRHADLPPLPATLIDLARWIAGYYVTPLGIVLASMLPAAVRKGTGIKRSLCVDLAPSLADPEADFGAVTKSAAQRRILEALAAVDPAQRPADANVVLEQAEVKTRAPLKALIDAGALIPSERTSVEAAWAARADPRELDAPTLTPDQQGIVDAVAPSIGAGFSAHLLFGVTGSGKTEVYIRLIEQALARDLAVLVLVPEIALTPQTGGRLIGRLPGHRVAVLHSALTAAQRHQQWRLALNGEADVILGARSAVFAPIPPGRLGLIIVDEEHDGSYKQDQAPRYHGRDVAVRRAHLEGCPVLLGSATPSLESWFNATRRNTYRLHQLPNRIGRATLPKVHVVDFAEERRNRRRTGDRSVSLIGPTMEEALHAAFRMDGQAILLLNRRGYANYISCGDQNCGWVMTCDDCDATVVYHKRGELPTGGFVRCHHCGAEQRLPETCPMCGKKVVPFGLGTQRVEEELARRFPEVGPDRMLRVDADTIRHLGDLHDALERFGSGELRLLVGTQMIAKGLDYPGVRMVGVINADTSINLPDFRAAERTFQLVNQVAGRSGRAADGAGPGVVIVQSFNPWVPAIRYAAAHDYIAFTEDELAHREAAGLPPFSRLARLVIRDEDHERGGLRARTLADALYQRIPPQIRMRGPAPCPISRIAGRHRFQVELFAPSAAALQQVLASARSERLIHPDAGLAVDVDPIDLL